jgi:hypothetical protein
VLTASLSQILADIHSSSPERQVGALDIYFSFPVSEIDPASRQEVVSATLTALERSNDPYFIAQRVARFGEEVIQPLSELMAHTSLPEVKTLAALILLKKGSRIGVPILVREIEDEGVYRVIASTALASAGVAEHVPAIFNRLRQYSPTSLSEFPTTQDDEVLSLLGVLKQLRVELPEEIKSKFSGPLVPRYFHDAIGNLSAQS